MISSAQAPVTSRGPGAESTVKNTALTERSIRRIWKNCVEAEEANNMLKMLVSEGRGTEKVEVYSRGRAGRERWEDRGEAGRLKVVKEEMLSRIDNSDSKVRGLKSKRKTETNKFKLSMNHNMFRRKMKKILEFASSAREVARSVQNQKVAWVRKKYGNCVPEVSVPESVGDYKECKIFKNDPDGELEESSGPVVVCKEGEKLEMSNDEWDLLARGPKYCVVRNCKEEDMRVELETCILKHKWDSMGKGEEGEDDDLSEEDLVENERVAQLAEEMGAQRRMAYDSSENSWDARGLRVTDYKHNSRVIFPKALPGEKENTLEVMRSELLHHHREWVANNCNCRGEQPANLSKGEQAGLKSIRRRVADGSIVILPTDKSGRFAVMSMDTYIEAGRVHVKDDEEVGISEMKENQKLLNGAVSMLLKVFRVGKESKHESRWRESMLSNSLESCPLWLLFKDHKNWSSSKGGPPPTRPVMGGNSGMNSHLSEILSWLLEPLANSMLEKSSEVISDEDLKCKIDNLNLANTDWKPEAEMESPISEHSDMSEQLERAPGLCGCEECVSPEEESIEDSGEGGESSQEEGSNGSEESTVPQSSKQPDTLAHPISHHQESPEAFARIGCNNQQPRPAVGPLLEVVRGVRSVQEESNEEGGGCANAQTGSVRVAASQSNTVKPDVARGSLEFIFSSMKRRGNRNKALLLRERREELKERRTNGLKRCGRVSSKQVSPECVQDRSQVLVMIGSDAVSLFPSLTKLESADEVAQAVMESSMKWEGVNWKEAVRFLALGRDEAWCRSSKLQRVLPWRRSTKGTRPGLTGVGPLGAESDDEKLWKFPNVELTSLEKKRVMSEVLRLSIEIMFSTHVYSFGGRNYKQKEGGPIGLRSTCALSRVVMARWDEKWKARVQSSNIRVEDDGRYVDDARVFMYPIRAGWRWEGGELWYKKEWEEEDFLLSPTERTKRVVHASMQGVTKCLTFTVETAEEFADGWLPTLDFKLRINSKNQIEYNFFEKPTASNRCLQSETALNQNCLIRSLVNEVGRRLDSFSETVTLSERVAVLDRFCQKLLNSGHSVATARRILVSGITGHQRKVARCLAARTPLHRSAQQSAATRRTKKLLAKSNWFRNSREEAEVGEESSAKRNDQPGGGSRERKGVARGKAAVATGQKSTKDLVTTTVLFVEFSKGGALQKCLRDALDRLTPMLGFKVRVTERGGTSLGSLLSNKNLWSGEPCGREDCRPCKQPGEKKESCTTRNVVYESECGECNKEGSRKLADKVSLADKREIPSLYVGETARSIKERSSEHWADAEKWQEECHMVEHQTMAHNGRGDPKFNFSIVKKCGSSLERQVREAVRIQMRGVVLNKKGTYNRCKLTRLVVDSEWEERVWRESWVPRGEQMREDQEWCEWEGEECLAAPTKPKRPREDEGVAKRARLEPGVAWGEGVQAEVAGRENFLNSKESIVPAKNQTKLRVISGVEWMCRELLKEAANSAVAMGELLQGVAEWEEWQGEDRPAWTRRSEREEMYLWAMLRVLDKESAGEERRMKAKQKKVVLKARKKMGARKDQPSILDIMVRAVPQPTSRAGPQPSATHAQARAVPQPLQTQAPVQTVQAEQTHTLAHPINQPQESSEAFARIGLVPDEVSPKKLKTREHNQQPRPAVEPLLGVVRGVRGVKGGPRKEGGGCVNTQTGSVSVAGSQNNIVLKDNEEGGGCVNTQTGSVSVAGSQSNIVQPDVRIETTKYVKKYVGSEAIILSSPEQVRSEASVGENSMCVQSDDSQRVCVQTARRAVTSLSSSSTERTSSILVPGRKNSIRAKFVLSNLEGGKFNIKIDSPCRKEGTEKEGKRVSDSDRENVQKQNIQNIRSLLPSSRDEFRGENRKNTKTFNNIDIVIKTPKRKKESTVSKLVCKFSGGTQNLPAGESPAKRRRLWGQGGQGQ